MSPLMSGFEPCTFSVRSFVQGNIDEKDFEKLKTIGKLPGRDLFSVLDAQARKMLLRHWLEAMAQALG
jgi:hypothetical protein